MARAVGFPGDALPSLVQPGRSEGELCGLGGEGEAYDGGAYGRVDVDVITHRRLVTGAGAGGGGGAVAVGTGGDKAGTGIIIVARAGRRALVLAVAEGGARAVVVIVTVCAAALLRDRHVVYDDL